MIVVTPYNVTYDGNPHTATGTATGVETPNPANLSGLLNLSGTTHTDIGTYTDTWTFAGNGNYNSASGTITDVITQPLTVTAIAAISPNPRTTPVSTVDVTFSLPIDTSSPTAGAVTLTDNGSPVAVSGVSFALVPGTTSTYQVGDLSAFTAAAGSYTLTVNAADIDDQYGNPGTGSLSTSWLVSGTTPTISWANPADIVYGTALSGTQLDATANVLGTFTYTPAAGTILGAGNNQTLSVLFTPDDTTDYTSAFATATINVLQATPTISWSNPANIVYGTALSGTQLDATSSWTVGGVSGSVAGTFTYTPAAGTVLGAGDNQTLSVLFTPTDTTDYTTAAATATINVLQATPTITWSNPANIVYGTALERNAVGRHFFLDSGRCERERRRARSLTPRPRAPSWMRATTRRSRSSSRPPTRPITPRPPRPRPSTSRRPRQPSAGPARRTSPTARRCAATQLDATSSWTVGGVSGQRGGHVHLLAGRGHRPGRGQQPDALGQLHAHRHDRLHDGHRTTTINVAQATPTITLVQPGEHHLRHGASSTQLDATSSWTVGGVSGTCHGTFTYSPAAGTVLGAGNNQTLSVIFTPDDTTDYTTASATATINVLQATPTISWSNPANIALRHGVERTQLDATSSWTVGGVNGSVEGTFTYTPAAGTSWHRRQPDALGPLHARRHGRLHHGRRDGDDRRLASNSEPSVGPTPHHPLRHAALSGRSSMPPLPQRWAESSGSVAGTFTYTPAAGTVLARRRPDAVGPLHAHGRDRLHHGHRDGDDQRRARQLPPSVGPIQRTSSTARH